MFTKDLSLVFQEVVLGASDDSKVWRGLLVDSNGDLELLELEVVVGVLHLFKNDAFLHLSDVLLLNDAHQFGENVVDKVRVKLVVISHAFGEEVLTSLFAQD